MSSPKKISSLAKKEPPLCVDLDGTLLKTDTLYEQVIQFLKAKPFLFFKLGFWFARSPDVLKEQLAKVVKLDPARLPYNQEVLSFLRKEQQRGRTLLLVSGAHHSIVKSVSNHLRLFSEAYGTHLGQNLVAKKKADLLTAKFGRHGFDYMGDSRQDLAVWASASNAIFAGRSRFVLAKARDVTNVAKIIPSGKVGLKTLAKAIRCHQWIKNILVVLPVVFANRFSELDLLYQALLGFLAFSFAASSIYVVNDLMDLADDRAHPDKSKRPFASGDLSVKWALLIVPILLLAAATLAFHLPATFQVLLASYMGLTIAYNFILKQIAIADILVLASVFCARLFAGSAATAINLSPWLIAFTGFFFLSLALVKRCSELIMLKGLNESETKGRGYQVQDTRLLISLGTTSGYLSILVLALYLSSENAKNLYLQKDFLWAICPLALYWLSRVWLLTNRGEMHSDPISFALRDKASWCLVFMVFVIWSCAHGFLFRLL